MFSGSPNALCLPRLISALAAQSPLTPDFIRSQAGALGFSNWGEKRFIKTTVQFAKDFRLRGQLGRLRATALFGASLAGSAFVIALERAGVLLAEGHCIDKFGRFLAHLQAEIDAVKAADWSALQERLPTYEAYRQLTIATSRDEEKMVRLLRSRPRHIIKKVLAVTDLCFLRRHFGFEVSPELSKLYEEFGTAEEMASAASILVAQANSHRPLDSADLGFPVMGNLADQELWAVMRYGHAQSQRLEIGKEISLFGYRLEKIDAGQGPLFYLRPPSVEFEYFLRLGFIRTEIGMSSVPLDVSKHDPVPELSLMNAAEFFVHRFREHLCELADGGTPLRRVRLKFPLDPELYKFVSDGSFYDDAADSEMLGHEFLFPLQRTSEAELMLTDKLDLRTFLRTWRLLRYMSLVDIAVLRPYARRDPMLFLNSLVRVTLEDNMVNVIASLGIEREHVLEFLRLVSADVHRLGYYDLQYRPFLRIATTTLPQIDFTSRHEIVHPSALVAVSNIIRNVQSANQIRFSSNASIFVDVVADMFRAHFEKVTVNRRIKANRENTDVDVVVLDGNALYLFECKHSVPPTGPHEMRDIWEEVEKGIRQLRIALNTLADPERLHDYLTGWFPGTKRRETEKLRIVPCVLTSHRIFSGLTQEGIPIRDFASLTLIASDGVVRMGILNPNGDTTLIKHRLTNESGLSAADVDDYLSSDSRYFKMFRPFMRPLSRFQWLGHVTVARDTYAYEVDSDEYLAHLETIGCVRLPDEQKRLKLPVSFEDFLDKNRRTTAGNGIQNGRPKTS
jgi:hypothetical protein